MNVKIEKEDHLYNHPDLVDFKSSYVQEDSQTPYSDATNTTHDPENIKRPMNTFMIFSHYERMKVNAQSSTCLGKKWKELSEESKALYKQEAETLRKFHLIEYPGYRFQPRKKEQSQMSSFLSIRKLHISQHFGKQSSFKISNCFGSNSWVNSPVSYLSNVKKEPINPSNFSLKVTIDSHFKEMLRNSHQEGMEEDSFTSDSFSSPESSPTYSIKRNIHSVIEEFLGEPSSSFFSPCTPSQTVPLSPTPTSTPLDFNPHFF